MSDGQIGDGEGNETGPDRGGEPLESDTNTGPGPNETKRRPKAEVVRSSLGHLRHRRRYHVAALLVLAVVGLFLSWLHWFGLVLAGTLLGIVSRGLREAVLSALGFGTVLVAVFLVSSGAATRVVGMEPIIYVTVAGALVLPVLGSLVRGLESDI